jgi:dTMP kinase
MSGLFITFEGADGCGKSTQLRLLAEYLEENGAQVVRTREPGGSLVAEKIREILLDKENVEMDAMTEALLYAAARAEHVRKVIKPALCSGKVVLCDRFIHSSLAYQGYGRSLGVPLVQRINEPAIDGCMPDVTVFLGVPPENAFSRMNDQKEHDRLESEGLVFHERVFDGFTALSSGSGMIVIDALGSKHETQDVIRQRLMPLFKQKGLL